MSSNGPRMRRMQCFSDGMLKIFLKRHCNFRVENNSNPSREAKSLASPS
jgi:hypothetical protein